jgi:hypothetical protein
MTLNLEFNTDQLLDSLGVGNILKLIAGFLLPDAIPIDANLILEFDNPYPLVEFPLDVDSYWGIQGGIISIDGTIESRYFRTLAFINNIFKIFGINLIPPELAEYLPVIDISDILAELEIPAEIEIPEMEEFFRKAPFEVELLQQISVGAGSFNAYNIEFLQGTGELFYSPEAENFVKIEGNLHDFIPIAEDIKLELISMS